ncbi:MAG: hypothetical protein JRJ11_16465, partial [Deltaproteobacteria bacterium]|nr:hypothetical protein [Deltaproteobacteria bacterium]
QVTVKGTVTNAADNETGVVVNGVLSMVYGNEFVANHVPLEEGENTITATATDAAGNTLSTAIIVNADTTGDYIWITVDIHVYRRSYPHIHRSRRSGVR